MSAQAENLHCPFCDFVDTDSYFLLQHVELIHPEDGESPFVVKDAIVADQGLGRPSPPNGEEATWSNGQSLLSAKPGTSKYIDCPYGCGESILSDELQVHQDLHVAESMAIDELDHPASSEAESSTGPSSNESDATLEDVTSAFSTDIPRSLRNYDQSQPMTPSSHKRRRSALIDLFFGSPTSPKNSSPKSVSPGKTRRLGRSELGPHAHEKQMPTWLRKMLEDGSKVTITNNISPNGTIVKVESIANETPELVPVLARLSYLDRSVDRAYYCNPAARHIAKMQREGGFCGYRNIQMLISYIRGAEADGHWHFKDKIPSILKIQDLIEQAWDMGFNSQGKVETGGIRLTRKYIGTPEAQALFQSLAIRCEASAFMRYTSLVSYESMLVAVGEYFSDCPAAESDEQVIMTNKPPVYFQHAGHSMTIVGLEVRKNGAINLVVFDPMFNPSPAIKKLIGSNSFKVGDPARLLKAHRRGEGYLSRYKDFEILALTGPLSEGGDWTSRLQPVAEGSREHSEDRSGVGSGPEREVAGRNDYQHY